MTEPEKAVCRYVGAYETTEMRKVSSFYVNPNTMELSQTPREGFELHPAFIIPTEEQMMAAEIDATDV